MGLRSVEFGHQLSDEGFVVRADQVDLRGGVWIVCDAAVVVIVAGVSVGLCEGPYFLCSGGIETVSGLFLGGGRVSLFMFWTCI